MIHEDGVVLELRNPKEKDCEHPLVCLSLQSEGVFCTNRGCGIRLGDTPETNPSEPSPLGECLQA
jgi:hypothetical protein